MKTDSRVWAGDLRGGALPHVCVVTGEPTEDSLKYRFSTSPTWVLLLLLVGVLPYLIAVMATAKRAEGELPLVRRQHRRVRLTRWGGWGTIGVAFVVFVVAAGLGSSTNDAMRSTAGLLALFALLLIVVGLLGVILRGFLGIGGRVEGVPGVPDYWVTLRGVHPAFAEAVLRMYAERAAQAPQPIYVAAPLQYQAPVYQQPYSGGAPPPADAPLPPPYTGPV